MPDTTINISQLVGYNLARIRKALGLSQDQAAERLVPYLGARWSKTVYSLAERSYAGKRVRQFTAAELAAFAAAFEVPIVYFFLPPKPEDRIADGVLLGDRVVEWPELFELMLGGKQRRALGIRVTELADGEWPRIEFFPALGLGEWAAEHRTDPEENVLRFKPWEEVAR